MSIVCARSAHSPVLVAESWIGECESRLVHVTERTTGRNGVAIENPAIQAQWHCVHRVICQKCGVTLQNCSLYCPDKPAGMTMIGQDIAERSDVYFDPYTDSMMKTWELHDGKYPIAADGKRIKGRVKPAMTSKKLASDDREEVVESSESHVVIEWDPNAKTRNAMRHVASGRGMFGIRELEVAELPNGKVRVTWSRKMKRKK